MPSRLRQGRALVSPAKVLVVLSVVPLACQWGSVVTLGDGPPLDETGGEGGAEPKLALRVHSVRALSELNTDEQEDNPTLTADERLLCFTARRDSGTGGIDIWCAERSDREHPFSDPFELSSLNTDGFESSSALSPDGLTLWFGSDVDGHVDIFTSRRPDRASPWGPREHSTTLSSDADDIPRPTALGDRVMPLASRRDGDDYWTYLATRPTPEGAFGSPELIEELAEKGRSIVDAFLREDGLVLIFKSQNDDDPGDLYYSERDDLEAPFGEPLLLEGANSDGDDRDPWLSLDGKRLYFSSDREGELDLYVAEVSD